MPEATAQTLGRHVDQRQEPFVRQNEKKPPFFTSLEKFFHFSEKRKNNFFAQKMADFKKAFPDINLDIIQPTDLKAFGIKPYLFINEKQSKEMMTKKDGRAFHEAVTELISTYVDLKTLGLPTNSRILTVAGKGYSENINFIVKQLITIVAPRIDPYEGQDEEAMDEAVQAITRAHFTGNWDYVQSQFAKKINTNYFKTLLEMPVLYESELPNKIMSKLSVLVGPQGAHFPSENSVFIYKRGMAVMDVLRIFSLGVDEWLRKKTGSGLDESTFVMLKLLGIKEHVANHEFAHFLAFAMAKKRGGDPMLDRISKS